MRLRYTRRALADLNRAVDYTKQHSPKGAARIGARIEKRINDLKQFPLQGTPTRSSDRRSLVVTRTHYVVTYIVAGDEIWILSILHAKRRR